MQNNLFNEAEMPGSTLTVEEFQMICCRYYTASPYIQGKQVLEIGCGPGLGLGYLAERAKKIVGGDCNKNSLKYAKKHYGERVELSLFDAHNLPFKDGCFDVVMAMEVLLYLHAEEFLEECHRILKRKGSLILCLPNKDREDGFQESFLSYKYYSGPELLTLLKKHCFNARIFGAFPIPDGKGEQARKKIQQTLIESAGKTLNLMPKGKTIKNLLNKLLLHKIVLKEEIEEKDMIYEKFHLESLDGNYQNGKFKIIYSIAHAQ